MVDINCVVTIKDIFDALVGMQSMCNGKNILVIPENQL